VSVKNPLAGVGEEHSDHEVMILGARSRFEQSVLAVDVVRGKVGCVRCIIRLNSST
jgi:hypothetical protein